MKHNKHALQQCKFPCWQEYAAAVAAAAVAAVAWLPGVVAFALSAVLGGAKLSSHIAVGVSKCTCDLQHSAC